MLTGPDVATHDDDIVEAIYACATDEKALPRLLERLAARYSCISAAILFVDPHRPVADVALCQGVLTEEVQARYRAEFAALDPAPKAMALLGAGEATTTDRLYDEDAKRRSASFLDHFYYPLGLRETLGGPFVKTEGRFGVLAVHRGADRDSFSDDEVARFARLLPHLGQAFSLRSAFLELEARVDALQAAVEPVSTGLIVLDAAGLLEAANRAARAVLARADGLTVDWAGRIGAVDAGANAKLLALLAEDGGAALPAIAIPRHGGAPPYALRLARVAGRPGAAGARFVLVVCAPEDDPPQAADLIGAVYGLRPAEARLAAALAAGRTLQSYARDARISMNTAKFHLKAVFAATGTRRQADLVRRLGVLIHDLAPTPAPEP